MIATRSEAEPAVEGMFGKVLERIRRNVNMELACGESRVVGEITIIPIGVVAYGFGFGMGSQPGGNGEAGAQAAAEGSGGGGGAVIQPIAIVTVTNGQAKVTPVLDWARVLTGVVGVIGKMILSRGGRGGRSVFGPGSLSVLAGRGKRATGGKGKPEEADEQEG